MLAVNAVGEKIKRYERMLAENSAYDTQEVGALLNSYREAAEQLQQGYLSTIGKQGNHQQGPQRIAC